MKIIGLYFLFAIVIIGLTVWAHATDKPADNPTKQLGFYNYTKDLETISKNKGETPEGQPKLTNQEILNVIQSIVVQFKEKGYEILGIESDRNLIWVYGAIKQPKDNPLPPE